MLHSHHLPFGPMEVKCDEGYLLVELCQGIADYPPDPTASGTNLWLQEGHTD
jgi:hypothetical protein